MNKKIDSKLHKWRIAILIITLCLVSFLSFQLALSKENRSAQAIQTDVQEDSVANSTITPESKEARPFRWNCEGPEVEVFRTQLALIPESDVVKRKYVEEELIAWETRIAVCETVMPQMVIPEDLLQFTQETAPPFETGIFEGQPGAFFHGFEAKIENHWKGIIDGRHVTVFAGVWVNDPSQGFLKVKTDPLTRGHSIWGYYPSSQKSGALRIVDAKDARLVIQPANDKNLLFFDVPALTYVNSLDEIVTPAPPTIIPVTGQPSPVPYPYPYP